MRANIENPVAYENAIRRNIIQNARKTFLATYDRSYEVVDFLISREDSSNDFIRSLAGSLYTYGKLTVNQYMAVIKMIDKSGERKAIWAAKREEAKAQSEFVGEVGKRQTFKVTVEKILTVDCAAFSYYDRSSMEIYLMRDENGNRIVLKTKSDTPVEEGACYVIKASVKEHKDYNGEKQTVVQRVKFD